MSDGIAWAIGVLSLGLAVQGIALLCRENKSPRCRGSARVVLGLAGQALLCCVLLATGGLVPGPELGVLLVAGNARFAVPLALFVVCLAAANVVDLARSPDAPEADPPGSGGVTGLAIPVALLIALLGLHRLPDSGEAELNLVLGIGSLFQFGPEPSAVLYAYPVWSPPLLLWLATCMAWWLGVSMGARSLAARLLLVALSWLLLALAERYRSRTVLQDLGISVCHAWPWTLTLSASAVCGLSAHVTAGAFGRPTWMRHAGALAMAPLGWVAAGTLLERPSPLAWVPFAFTLAGMVAAVVRLQARQRLRLTDLGAPGRLDDVALVAAFFVTVFFWADLFCFGWLPPWVSLAGQVVAIIALVELVTPRPTPLLAAVRGVASRLKQGVRRTAAAASNKALAAPAAQMTWPGLAMRLVLLVVGLTVLVEVPYAGKTVINPFRSVGFGPEGELGTLLADQVSNTLAQLEKDLLTDVTLSNVRSEVDYLFKAASPPPATETAASTDAIPIGGYRIPIGVFLAPVRIPVRWLLGIRVVNGTVYLTGQGIRAFATSSDGSAWEARMSRADAAASGTAGDPEVRKAETARAAADLGQQLALEMTTTGTTGSRPATRSSVALKQFREAMAEWRRYALDETDFHRLAGAIDGFRKAIEQDRGFALAHYRLGLALNQEGQPRPAVNALKRAVTLDPSLLAAKTALAATLVDLDDLHGRVVPWSVLAGEPREPAPDQVPPDLDVLETKKPRNLQAERLWKDVLQAEDVRQEDLAAATLGLCRLHAGDLILKESSGPAAVYRAYHHCQRAKNQYMDLLRQDGVQSELRATVATVLNELASTLWFAGQTIEPSVPPAESDWHCRPDRLALTAIDPRLGRQALRLFRKASQLDPDDPVLRCSSAALSASLGDGAPMQSLRQDPGVLTWQGEDLLAQAIASSSPEKEFSQALEVLQRAINVDPQNLVAMNWFGYGFWLWRLRVPDQGPPAGPDLETAFRAEQHVREAHRIGSAHGDPDAPIYASTLAEVLLGQGRPHEAITFLHDVLKKLAAPDSEGSESAAAGSERASGPAAGQGRHPHWRFAEISSDLVQAYLCATSQETAPAPRSCQHSASDARRMHNRIRDQAEEHGLELWPYSAGPGLPAPEPPIACTRARRVLLGTEPLQPIYRLPEERPIRRPGAFRPGRVRIQHIRSADGVQGVRLAAAPPDTLVRVWGRGVHAWIDHGRTIVLDGNQARVAQYFGRVETAEGAPLSEPFALETFAEPSRQLIEIALDPPRGLYRFQSATEAPVPDEDGASAHRCGFEVRLPEGEWMTLAVAGPETSQVLWPDASGGIRLEVPESQSWHIQARDLFGTPVSEPITLQAKKGQARMTIHLPRPDVARHLRASSLRTIARRSPPPAR